MSSKDIRQLIIDFLKLIEQGTNSVESNEFELVLLIDKIALAMHSVKPSFDEKDYPDPPVRNQKELRKLVTQWFPNYGLYNIPLAISQNIGKTELLVGDAVDDIIDISNEFREVQWRFENTSSADALWHLHLLYISHWGNHLRNLQWYLHSLE